MLLSVCILPVLSCDFAMPDTRSQKVKDFTETAETAGLKDGTIHKLLGQDIDSPEIVALLEEDDFDSLQLSRGQTLVLRKWSRDLAVGTTASVSGDEPDEDSTPAEPSPDDLLVQLERPEEAVTEPTADYKALGKPLFITDFINRATVGLSDTVEWEVCHEGDAQLVLHAARQKPIADQVTLAQWVGANARIMERLIQTRQLQSVDELCQYLDYTVKISDFAQVNELPRV